jgi:hypothetical protein
MSSTIRTNETDTTDHGTTHAVPAVPESTATTTARTETEDKLWEALRANLNSTAAELSSDAGIGRSTAAKILARWANDGSVTRTSGLAEGGRRAADLWAITDPNAPSPTSNIAVTEHVADTDENAATPSDTRTQTTDTDETTAKGDAPDQATAAAEADTGEPSAEDTSADGQQKTRRLPPGGLRGLVEDWLRDHPRDEFSPSAIGKALGRSSGAVANALDKLVADGYATQTCDKPKRFTAAKTTPEPATPN